MAKTPGAPKSFESALTELEAIVQEMESGTISLEQALDRYQRGMSLLKHCQDTLKAAEQRVLQLENDVLAPLNPAADTRDQE
jgi:exodeoxyribonuclease VII small subunit